MRGVFVPVQNLQREPGFMHEGVQVGGLTRGEKVVGSFEDDHPETHGLQLRAETAQHLCLRPLASTIIAVGDGARPRPMTSAAECVATMKRWS